MVLIHTEDPVIRRVEQVGEVMSRTSGPQLCMDTKKGSYDSWTYFYVYIFSLTHRHAQLKYSSCHCGTATWTYLMVFHEHNCNSTPHIRDKCYWGSVTLCWWVNTSWVDQKIYEISHQRLVVTFCGRSGKTDAAVWLIWCQQVIRLPQSRLFMTVRSPIGFKHSCSCSNAIL